MDGTEDDAVYADVCKSRDGPSDDTADDVSDDDCDEENVYDDLIPNEEDLDKLFGGGGDDDDDGDFDGFDDEEQN